MCVNKTSIIHQFSLMLFLTLTLTLMVTFNDDYRYQKVNAHDFSTTDESSLVTLVEQIKAETQLVITDVLSNNNTSANVHAGNAAGLIEILQSNMTRTDPPSSDITQIYDQGQKNSTTLALVVANIVDDVLRKYGSAFAVAYDMTNMSNMMNMEMMAMPKMDNSPSHSMNVNTTSIAATSSGDVLGGRLNMTNIAPTTSLKLVNVHDYETAKVLASNIKDEFSTKLRPRSLVNETANLNKLEDSLERLEQAVNTKALPEAMMGLVHVQTHPTLQRVYDLDLRRNIMAGNSD